MQVLRVSCSFLIFPNQVQTWPLPKRVLSTEVMKTVLYLRVLKKKENQHLSLFCFLHRSTAQSPSHPLHHILRRMMTIFCLKDYSGCLEKGDNFRHEEEVTLKKFSAYSQYGTCWLCQQSLEKMPITNDFWASPVVTGTSAAALSRIRESSRLEKNSKNVESNLYHVSCQVPPYDKVKNFCG